VKPLSKIIFYPVKAFGGQSVESCEIENNRIKYDRIFGFRFAKADEFLDYKWKNKHNFVTLSNTPGLAKYNSLWDPKKRVLEIISNGRTIDSIVVDKNRKQFEKKITNLISKMPVNPKTITQPEGTVKLVGDGRENFFQDSELGQITMHGLSSVRAIESRCDREVSSRRFRSNLIIDGLSEWEEFGLVGEKINIGECQFLVKKTLTRCIATHVNPINAERDLEVMNLLPELNGVPEPSFGVALEYTGVGNGLLNVGDLLLTG
jgi:uncharacterized protein YcbX|tara:strand:+ start:58 stop:843 length:786 start_codon:yes stop_codon:yes gene_type:complete